MVQLIESFGKHPLKKHWFEKCFLYFLSDKTTLFNNFPFSDETYMVTRYIRSNNLGTSLEGHTPDTVQMFILNQ